LIPCDRLDVHVATYITGYLTRPDDVEKRVELVRHLRAERELAQNRELAEQNIAQLEENRKRVLYQHRKGWITNEAANKQWSDIETEMARWEAVPEAAPMPDHVRDGWNQFRYAWAQADLMARITLVSEIASCFYLDPGNERVVAFKPTDTYLHYFAVEPETGLTDIDWLSWAFGRKPRPTRKQPTSSEPQNLFAAGSGSPGRG
jgi:hypothetical protein